MADLFVGIALGQIDGMSDQIVTGSVSAGAAVDVEVRVRNTPSVGGIGTIEVNKALEQITWYFINKGVDFNATTPSMPDL